MTRPMNRLALACCALLLTASTARADHHEHNTCEEICSDCRIMCLQCARACADEDRLDCAAMCLDCADMCAACSAACARKGPLMKHLAKACAGACEMCHKECKQHTDDEVCQKCAEMCLKCSKECAAMAK